MFSKGNQQNCLWDISLEETLGSKCLFVLQQGEEVLVGPPGCPLLSQDAEQCNRVFADNCVALHHLHPTFSGIPLIQVGSRIYANNSISPSLRVWRVSKKIEQDVPTNRTCRFHLGGGTCSLFRPSEDIRSYSNGFEGLVLKSFIFQLSTWLSYSEYVKGKCQ